MELHTATEEDLLLELIQRLNMHYGEISFPVDGGRPGNLRAVHKTLTIRRHTSEPTSGARQPGEDSKE